MAKKIRCHYCNGYANLISSEEVYGKDYGLMYLCKKCDAYVGCHKGTDKPLGKVANKELREIRKKAHYYFDKLWRYKMQREGVSQYYARNEAYQWLAEKLNLPVSKTHIAMFGMTNCQKVIKCCAPLTRKLIHKE